MGTEGPEEFAEGVLIREGKDVRVLGSVICRTTECGTLIPEGGVTE